MELISLALHHSLSFINTKSLKVSFRQVYSNGAKQDIAIAFAVGDDDHLFYLQSKLSKGNKEARNVALA